MSDSPTPPAPAAEDADLESTRGQTNPSVKLSSYSQHGTSRTSNVPWRPTTEDASPIAIDWRARRGVRKAEEACAAIGHPTTQNPDGSVRKAEGIWWMLENLTAKDKELSENVKSLMDARAAQKQARDDISGFVKTRAERILDKLFLLFLTAAFAYFTRRMWIPQDSPLPTPLVQEKH